MRFGISGHQRLPAGVAEFVGERLDTLFSDPANLVGTSSLAGGADQIFARKVLDLGGRLEAVVPCARYEESFGIDAQRDEYEVLRREAADITVLPYPTPSQEAFLAAGLIVVERSQHVIAVWDGQLPRGLGGTADVIEYASRRHRIVTVLWPDGTVRA